MYELRRKSFNRSTDRNPLNDPHRFRIKSISWLVLCFCQIVVDCTALVLYNGMHPGLPCLLLLRFNLVLAGTVLKWKMFDARQSKENGKAKERKERQWKAKPGIRSKKN